MLAEAFSWKHTNKRLFLTYFVAIILKYIHGNTELATYPLFALALRTSVTTNKNWWQNTFEAIMYRRQVSVIRSVASHVAAKSIHNIVEGLRYRVGTEGIQRKMQWSTTVASPFGTFATHQVCGTWQSCGITEGLVDCAIATEPAC